MTDIQDLDPEMRCFALVGQFLRGWSIMELRLNQAIGIAMKLTKPMRFIICANMQLRDKLNVLSTVLDISDIEPEADKKRLKKLLRDIGVYSRTRNMLAHDGFAPTLDGKDVSFFPVKAKGTFDVPELIWTVKNFEDEGAKVQGFADGVTELKKRLTAASFNGELLLRSGPT